MKIHKVLLIIVYLLLFLGGLEFALTKMGHKPGWVKVEGINFNSNLTSMPNVFLTDSAGIYKVSFDFVKDIQNTHDICSPLPNYDWDIDNFVNIFHSAKCLLLATEAKADTCKACNTDKDAYPFKSFLIQHKDDQAYDYLLDYLERPINEDGFRSISFNSSRNTAKTKVLLIGDSYTWGLSANPIFNSFADILLSKDYMVYNTGIPATDPAQYAAIVEKYIPLIQPDIVLVNFYVANDFMSFSRDPQFKEPIEYFTNQGFISSAPIGEFLEFEDAKKFYEDMLRIPDSNSPILQKLYSSTCIGSAVVWPFVNLFSSADREELEAYEQMLNMPLKDKAFITKPYIDAIDSIAEFYDVPCSFVIIPEVPFVWSKKQLFKNQGRTKEALDIVFADTGYSFPEIFCLEDNAEQGHFNNQGSAKYAEYLDQIIQLNINK